MGVSIHVYKIEASESLESVPDLEEQLQEKQDYKDFVDLFQLYEDLAMVLADVTDPFEEEDTFEYQVICGQVVPMGDEPDGSYFQVGGFLSSQQVRAFHTEIINRGLNTEAGFMALYDRISEEVKSTLDEYGSPDKEILYEGYFEPLMRLYAEAAAEGGALVFCAG